MLEKIKNIINSQLYPISLYARQIAGTLVLFVIARYLPVYDYGLFSSYKNIAVFWFTFANLGFAEYILVSSKAEVKEVKLKISLFLLNAVIIGLIITFCSVFFKFDNRLLFYLIVVRTFFDGVFFALILPYFQATKTFNTIAKINIFYAIGISIIAIISYFLKLSLTEFLILNICLGLFNFIQCSIHARINYLLVLNHIKRFLNMVDKDILKYSMVEIASIFYIQIQSLYVSAYLPKEDAALFFSAFTIISVIGIFINAQKQKLIPELIKNENEKIWKTIKFYLLTTFLLISLILVVLIFFGKNILSLLYGQEYYQNAYNILLIFTFATYFTGMIVITGSYLTAINKVQEKIPLQIEAIFVAVLTLLIFKQLGLLGSVYSYLITAIYLSIRYLTVVKNKINKGGLHD